MVTKKSLSVLKMAYISLGAVLIALCSWISVPATVPFTLQTFAVLLVCDLLGGRWGLVSVLLYLLLGAVLSICVVPYLIPDAIKIVLACLISERLRAALHL